MNDLSRFCCLNSKCHDRGKRGTGNLIVCDYYGRNNQRRMLYCRTCKARFSERRGTPFFHTHLPDGAAGLADHVWSLSEWLSFPAVQRT